MTLWGITWALLLSNPVESFLNYICKFALQIWMLKQQTCTLNLQNCEFWNTILTYSSPDCQTRRGLFSTARGCNSQWIHHQDATHKHTEMAAQSSTPISHFWKFWGWLLFWNASFLFSVLEHVHNVSLLIFFRWAVLGVMIELIQEISGCNLYGSSSTLWI